MGLFGQDAFDWYDGCSQVTLCTLVLFALEPLPWIALVDREVVQTKALKNFAVRWRRARTVLAPWTDPPFPGRSNLSTATFFLKPIHQALHACSVTWIPDGSGFKIKNTCDCAHHEWRVANL